jgi:hypothetical protein
VPPTLGRAGRGAQEAYAALTANPVPERRLEALHRLLGALAASGDVAALLRLPLAGVAQVQGGRRCGARAEPVCESPVSRLAPPWAASLAAQWPRSSRPARRVRCCGA